MPGSCNRRKQDADQLQPDAQQDQRDQRRKSILPINGMIRRNGRNSGSFNARTKGASGACGLTQLKTTSIRIKSHQAIEHPLQQAQQRNSRTVCIDKRDTSADIDHHRQQRNQEGADQACPIVAADAGQHTAQGAHQPVGQLESELRERRWRPHAHYLHPEPQQQHAGQYAGDGIDYQGKNTMSARSDSPNKNPLYDAHTAGIVPELNQASKQAWLLRTTAGRERPSCCRVQHRLHCRSSGSF